MSKEYKITNNICIINHHESIEIIAKGLPREWTNAPGDIYFGIHKKDLETLYDAIYEIRKEYEN